MTPSEVALLFRVTPDAVRKWCEAEKIPHFRTPGGHLRFHRNEIEPLVGAKELPAEATS